jgi:hypothetical protein
MNYLIPSNFIAPNPPHNAVERKHVTVVLIIVLMKTLLFGVKDLKGMWDEYVDFTSYLFIMKDQIGPFRHT